MIHYHKCLDCNIMWKHDGDWSQRLSHEDYVKVHTCEGCGRDIRHKYAVGSEITRRSEKVLDKEQRIYDSATKMADAIVDRDEAEFIRQIGIILFAPAGGARIIR